MKLYDNIIKRENKTKVSSTCNLSNSKEKEKNPEYCMNIELIFNVALYFVINGITSWVK